MKSFLLVAALAAAPHTASSAKLGAWNVEHSQDQFEESYDISTAAKDTSKKIDVILSCESGKEFRISFLGDFKHGPFPTGGRSALLLVEADDRRPATPLVSEPNRVPFMLEVPHAGAAERLVLSAKKLGIRIKSDGTKYKDYFFLLGDSAPAAALILKTCPPPN